VWCRKAVIREVRKVPKAELGFESTDDRWQLTIERDSSRDAWLPNGKTLRTLVKAWGRDWKYWIDKTILVWTVRRDVFGKMKDVIYAKPAPEGKPAPETPEPTEPAAQPEAPPAEPAA